MTSKPALTRLAAIGPPMMPRPMKPTVVMRFLLAGAALGAEWYRSVSWFWGRSAGAAALARQPGEAVGAAAAWDVLQPDPASIAGGGERAQVAVEVKRAGAGLVPPRSVGDLHVGNSVGVGDDHPVKVVAVDGEMVEVAEETEVAHASLAGDAVDHPDGVGGGSQGILGGAADRLDEHGAADLGRGPAGDGEVLDREVVLGGRVGAVGPVAVEGVEGPAAEPLPDADGHLDVVAEFPRAGGPGHQPAVAAWHVPGEEVQANQPHSGVTDGADERFHLTVRGDGDRERPPELHGVEPGLLGGRGPLQQRQFGEQDGAVDLVGQGVLDHGRLRHSGHTRRARTASSRRSSPMSAPSRFPSRTTGWPSTRTCLARRSGPSTSPARGSGTSPRSSPGQTTRSAR